MDFADFQGKIDVSPLDSLSGLRTNEQFSSFKLKITQNPQILAENPWILQIFADSDLKFTPICQNLQIFG